jgi:putative transposase
LLQQQEKFDIFIQEFNTQRPHQALDMKYPNELYTYSPRPYKGIQELSYPFHDRTMTVTNCGRICFKKKKINLSRVLAGQDVGVKEVNDGIWLVTFMDYDLGFFDLETQKLEPLEYPFVPEVV